MQYFIKYCIIIYKIILIDFEKLYLIISEVIRNEYSVTVILPHLINK